MITIIGGGSTGSSIAYHLASMGQKVTLIEREGIASGNTGKSSALVRTHYSNSIIASMALYSLKFFGNFDKIGYSGFTRNGMFFPFGEKYVDIAKENAEMLRNLGINELELDRSKIREYFPEANLDGYEYVLYEPESGYAEPVSTATSFVDKARELGAKIITKNEVERIESEGGSVRILMKGGDIIKSEKVVLATNTWTNSLLKNSGLSKKDMLPIHASLHTVINLRRPGDYQGIKPSLWDPPNLCYYKMEGRTVTVIGSLDPKIDQESLDADSDIPEEATEEYIDEYLPRIVERLPPMGRAGVISTHNGLYDMTPDGQAIIDSLEDIGLPSVYVCAGLSGHGFKLSPAYGKIVSEMVTDTEPDKASFDWRPFSKDRFSRNQPIVSRYSGIGTIY